MIKTVIAPEMTGNTMVTRRSMKKVMKVQQIKMMVVMMMMIMWVTSQGILSLVCLGLAPMYRRQEKMMWRQQEMMKTELTREL